MIKIDLSSIEMTIAYLISLAKHLNINYLFIFLFRDLNIILPFSFIVLSRCYDVEDYIDNSL